MTRRHIAVLALLLLTAGCSTTEEDRDAPPEVLYAEGMEALKEKRYATAAKRFEELDQRHPFAKQAMQAQVNLIFTRFKAEEYAEAISAAERFIRLHPRHAHAAYAYYMRGLAFYRQIADAHRDQDNTREASAAFREVVNRFPESDYAWEAERMLRLCKDRMAEQEMVVGRYYLDREDFLAAANRFRTVVETPEYNTTPYVEEALFSMVLTSLKLGMAEEARNYASVLGHNFSDSPFYARATVLVQGQGDISVAEINDLRQGVDEGSWMKRFLKGLTPGVASNIGD